MPAESVFATSATALQKTPSPVVEQLRRGNAQDVIVLFDIGNAAIFTPGIGLSGQRAKTALQQQLDTAKSQYDLFKNETLGALPKGDVDVRRDYGHLPMASMRIANLPALERLTALKGVRRVFADEPLVPHLTESLPLIGQPPALAAGGDGAGVTVVVLDTGVDYTRPEFGSCSAPGVAGCKVIVALDIAPNDGALDDVGHGTNVAGIVAGVAPQTQIAALDVFTATGPTISATTSDVIAGIDWAIANRVTYNVRAVNMSLGGGTGFTAPCADVSNPFLTPISDARAAGILTAASAGNEGYTDRLPMPACTPGAISVGAVYDANVGGLSWTSGCSDATTAADQIACFSNSATFLSVLAPGALITAAGYTMGGTSQAAPHVTGVIAVTSAAYPGETPDQIETRLKQNGVSVLDLRNGVTTPRVDLRATLRPNNDGFASGIGLSTDTGSAGGSNRFASIETGEPAHAGNTGGASVWWSWTASTTGYVTFDTHGSDFDTLLAVYSGGTAVDNTTLVIANDNDGSPGGVSTVSFLAQAGTVYYIAVDGLNGANGNIVLNWGPDNSVNYSDAEVPMLPPWAVLGMALVLIGVGRRRGA